MNKIKLLFASFVVALSTLVAPLAVVGVAAAQNYNPGGGACSGASGGDPNSISGNGQNCGNANGSNLPNVVKNIINIFSWIVGAVSVIMLIYGGFRYITSAGDSNNVTAAKNTILYAIIGLVIVAISQIVVQFVLSKATTLS